MPRFERQALVEKFQAMRAARVPIIGGGAGTGLSAKCEEAGGIDLIVIYNSGRYRMAGRGSMSGPAGLRQRQRRGGGNGAGSAARRAEDAGPRRRQRHRPVLPVRLVSGRAQGHGLLRSPELSDRRVDGRRVPGQPGGDRHVLRARSGYDPPRPREGHADHALYLRRGGTPRPWRKPAPISSSAISA